ncbi:hypothetical protein O0I10_000441 [Lichtheimia ornata]|uniref:SET domain-containing protein 9 n=1 Tax=Lichtheimia ornata TaxID=688661 RepID=A0AAD7Y5E8_9FUNG|nr:uncharacterized protein O0I10_000441 [Lichtheimia ornata]KAJ8664162.1 hypothetical protein O0I10_000441 [Lichtheimia ornata]
MSSKLKNFLYRLYPLQSFKLLAKTIRSPPKTTPPVPLPNPVDSVNQITRLLTTIHSSPCHPNETLEKKLGFSVHTRASTIAGAGQGVFLRGQCDAGQVVCLYPGTVYQPFEPLLFVSIANSYILKCFDGIFVDGKKTGLSGSVYRSLYHKENWPGAIQTSDATWMEDNELNNPLAIGQIVNNGSKHHLPNVQYHEVDLPPSFPIELRQYIPNIYWSGHDPLTQNTRVVALVSTRKIKDNDELFSTYMESI